MTIHGVRYGTQMVSPFSPPKLGRGTYGIVLRGHHPTSKIQVAIKEISLIGMPAAELHYLKQELQIMKTVDHPNIVKLLASEVILKV